MSSKIAPIKPKKKAPGFFKPGNTYSQGIGRPKGRLNDATLEIRNFSRGLFSGLFKDKQYVEALKDRIKRGRESPQVMALLLAYGYGRPPEKIIIDDPSGQLEGADYRVALIERLCNRLTAYAPQGGTSTGTQPPVNGGTDGAVVVLEAHGTTEPDSPAG